MSAGSPFVLRVPIDVSHVPDFTPGLRISVLVWNRQGLRHQRLVTFEKPGTVIVSFELEQPTESLRVVLGPEHATSLDLRHLQTPCVSVPCSAWQSSPTVQIPAIRVSAWDWWWWQHWRQTFRVTGRVVDAYGRPVVGAAVSAIDVDAWWWWTAREAVGSAVTAGDGSFFIEFTRCCGWWPWWWWATRDWQVDATLVEKITSFVHQYPGLGLLAAADNAAPTLEIFQPLLTSRARRLPSLLSATLAQAGNTIDPLALEQIRERLVEILPRRFSLPIWPWSEWAPWEDCGANVTFRVTEQRGDQTVVLLNEGIDRTRWEIPTALDVKLTTHAADRYPASADWTLVDRLFPPQSIPGELRRDRLAGNFAPHPSPPREGAETPAAHFF